MAFALALAGAVVLAASAPASGLHAQQPTGSPSQDSAQAEAAQTEQAQDVPGRVSPGGALLRSFAIPGWGQAAAGSPERGLVYFTLQSLSVWMVLKTSKTLGSANDILDMRVLDAEERLTGTVDPSDLPAAIDADGSVLSALNLVNIRGQQREDWFAFSIFLFLLGGADAFVAAHLADFPEPLETAIRPLPNMGVEIGFRLAF